MRNFVEVMEARRSVRKYTGGVVCEDDILNMLAIALSGETGRNLKSAEFIVVEDRETLDAMAKCRVGSAKMLERAGAAIVVVGDTSKSDTWIEDCCVAMAHLHLAATNLGLGSCWIQGRMREAENSQTTEEYLRGLLGFSENFKLEALLSVGVVDELPEKRDIFAANCAGCDPRSDSHGDPRTDPRNDPRVHRGKF